MIKINLLGAPKPKRGKAGRSSAADMGGGGGGEGSGPLLLIVMLVVFVGGAMGALYFMINQEDQRAAKLKSDYANAQSENRQLSEVKATYERKQKEADNYKHRVDVIDSLRAAQSGPVQLLSMLGDTINNTEAVWLNKMSDDKGTTVTLEGTALSMDAVANLMANLKKTGFFKTVEITETIQDDTSKDFTQYKFTLSLEKQTATAPDKKS